MEADKEVLRLLLKKKECFLLYEQETEKMNTNSTEAVEQIMEAVSKRQELIAQIDDLDEELDVVCRGDHEGEMLFRAARNQCDYKSLPAEIMTIYQAGQQIYQIISRIQDQEVLVEANLHAVQDRLLELIRQNKQDRKLSGYLKSMNYGDDVKKGFLYDQKR